MKIEIAFAGHFESVFEKDIVEANFFGLKEVAGEILLDNSNDIYSYYGVGSGSQVKVSFSLGEGAALFSAFTA
jgi:hypothetical protein